MEKLAVHGKFVPNAGLDISGIAGTGSDKEEEESKPPMDEEMKDVSKKDGGELISKLFYFFFFFPFLFFLLFPHPGIISYKCLAFVSKVQR